MTAVRACGKQQHLGLITPPVKIPDVHWCKQRDSGPQPGPQVDSHLAVSTPGRRVRFFTGKSSSTTLGTQTFSFFKGDVWHPMDVFDYGMNCRCRAQPRKELLRSGCGADHPKHVFSINLGFNSMVSLAAVHNQIQ